MVYYSEQVRYDLEAIRDGLLSWHKIALEYDFVISYMQDLLDLCDSLDTKKIHSKTTCSSHKRYGERVYRYRRNPSTIWYIIYNIDKHGNVFINKIMSNYITE